MTRTAHLCLRAISFCAILLVLIKPAQARIALVISEPFGSFGTMMPVGHSSIYLDHLCAASPTRLRPCRPGELGVVLARYHDLFTRNLDWIAIPAFDFFYGVDQPDQIPAYVTPSLEVELRESYRQAHLADIIPSIHYRFDKHGNMHTWHHEDWEEGIGAAFDRRLFIYSIETTPEQDAELLTFINTSPNHRRYTLRRANCADFAAELLSVVLPKQKPRILHRNVLADFDMTTPKNLARQLDAYGRAHPSLNLRVYEVPQLAGSLRRSRPIRGPAEMFVKTKRYLATVLVLQPELVLTDWIIYETEGKWTTGRDAAILTPAAWTTVRSQPLTQTAESSTRTPDAWSPFVADSAPYSAPQGTDASLLLAPSTSASSYSPASTSSRIFSESIGFLAK